MNRRRFFSLLLAAPAAAALAMRIAVRNSETASRFAAGGYITNMPLGLVGNNKAAEKVHKAPALFMEAITGSPGTLVV